MNRSMIWFAPLLVATIGLVSSPARAQCFLKIGTIRGDSTDARHAGEIDITSWGWSLTQSASAHVAAGAGSGSADVKDLKLTKVMDQASPILAQTSYTGTDVKTAVLSCRANSRGADFLTMTLSGTVFVSSYQVSQDKDRPTEQITLTFASLKFEYRPIKADGTPGAAIISEIRASNRR
jgi:type VI secretion system secreted protein Hcp